MTPGEHPLVRLSEAVHGYRRALLGGYQSADLHQLRVHIRRIRSFMQYVPGCADRSLRAAWREIFVATNPARDWDVFETAIGQLMPDNAGEPLRAALREAQAGSRRHALDRLDSADWRAHSLAWAGWLGELGDFAAGRGDEVVGELVREARLARDQALNLDDRRSWHRLRIAIKNLRYVADIPATCSEHAAVGAAPDPLVEACKALQDVLGEWHDCMVQLELLAGPAFRAVPAPLRQRLSAMLAARRDALLAAARRLLGDQSELFGEEGPAREGL